MLPGSRYCLRSRAATSSVSDTINSTNEPLLFLYPRFFSSQFDKILISRTQIRSLRTRPRHQIQCQNRTRRRNRCLTTRLYSQPAADHDYAKPNFTIRFSDEVLAKAANRQSNSKKDVTADEPDLESISISISPDLDRSLDSTVDIEAPQSTTELSSSPREEESGGKPTRIETSGELESHLQDDSEPVSREPDFGQEPLSAADLELQLPTIEPPSPNEIKSKVRFVKSKRKIQPLPHLKIGFAGAEPTFDSSQSSWDLVKDLDFTTDQPVRPSATKEPTFEEIIESMVQGTIHETRYRREQDLQNDSVGSEPAFESDSSGLGSERDFAATEDQELHFPEKDNGWSTIIQLIRRTHRHVEFDREFVWLTTDTMKVLAKNLKTRPEISKDEVEIQKVVEVPEAFVVKLLGDDGENAWYIHVGSGCRAQLLGRGRKDGPLRKIILGGSKHAIELAEKSLKDDLENFKSPSLPPFHHFSADGNSPLLRSVWSVRKFRSGYEGDLERALRLSRVWVNTAGSKQSPTSSRVEDLPRPPEWTLASFANYVEHVTAFRQTRAPQKIIYHDGTIHEESVRDILVDLFHNPESSKYVTTRALRLAISFLHHHRFYVEIKALFPIIEELRSPGMFEAMLRAASSNYNMRLFRYLLGRIDAVGIQVGENALVSFLQTIRSDLLRVHFLIQITRRGLLNDPKAINMALNSTIGYQFRSHLRRGKCVTSFIEKMNKDYGKHWVSTSSINKMILETTVARDVAARNEILSFCFKRDVKLNIHTLNNALILYIESKQIMSGLYFFQKFTRRYASKPNGVTWQLLWYLACRRKTYNLCRVVWTYACLAGGASHPLKYTLLRFLCVPWDPNGTLTAGLRWRMSIGRFMVGILSKPPTPTEAGDLTVEGTYPDDPTMATLDHFFIDSKNRPRQKWWLDAAWKLITHDVKSSKAYEPVVPLSDILIRALYRDTFWQRSSDVGAFFTHAIPCPVIKKGEKIDKETEEAVQAVYTRSPIEKSFVHLDTPPGF